MKKILIFIRKILNTKTKYIKPEIENLTLVDNLVPEMSATGRSGMGNCKHTYR